MDEKTKIWLRRAGFALLIVAVVSLIAWSVWKTYYAVKLMIKSLTMADGGAVLFLTTLPAGFDPTTIAGKRMWLYTKSLVLVGTRLATISPVEGDPAGATILSEKGALTQGKTYTADPTDYVLVSLK